MPSIIDYRNNLNWNPRRAQWKKRSLQKIDKIILHQGLSGGDADAIHRYHTSKECHISLGRGTPRICYTFVIEFNGDIKQVNSLNDVVWHTRGQNRKGIGVLLQGDFNGVKHKGKHVPTDEQEIAYRWLMRYLLENLALAPESLKTHANFGKPACPGYVAEKWVQNLKEELLYHGYSHC